MVKIEVLWKTLYQRSIDYLWRFWNFFFFQNLRKKRYSDICICCKLDLNLRRIGALIWMHYLILRYRIKWMLAFNGLWWISKLWISLVVIFGDYLGFGILLKLIIDGKSIIGVNLNEWVLELLFILKGT